MKKLYLMLVLFSINFLAICSITDGWSSAQAHTHRPNDFLTKARQDKDFSRQVYKQYCALCHDDRPQINVGAPRLHYKIDWNSRWLQSKQDIWRHLSEGIGSMPPRGGCFECSDDDLMQVLDWMKQKQTKDH